MAARLGEAAIDAATETGRDEGGLPRRRVRVAGLAEAKDARLWIRLRATGDYAAPLESGESPRVETYRLQGGRTVYKITHPNGHVEYRDDDPRQHQAAPAAEAGRKLAEALKARGYPLAHTNDYCVPLGKTGCMARDDEPDAADVEVMHVIPVRFLEPEGARLGHLREGYLYIFVEGHLWRELRVNPGTRFVSLIDPGNWMYHDVNLAQHQGLDVRPWSEEAGQRGAIVLPRRIDGEAVQVEVAFSETQWSWEYLCRLGGMAEDDPRYVPEFDRHRPYRDIEPDDALRRSRLQRIDLAGYEHGEKTPEEIRAGFLLPVAQAHRDNNPENEERSLQGQLRQTLPFLLPPYNDSEYVVSNAQVPVLALHDPLGVADELYQDFAAAYLAHADWLEQYGPGGAPEEAVQGANREGETVIHPPAPRYKRLVLARYVKAVLDANPALREEKDLVDTAALEAELNHYEQTRARTEAELERLAARLVEFLGRSAEPLNLPLPPDTVAAALLDYHIGPRMPAAHRGSDRVGEGVRRFVDYLELVSQTDAGNDFLVRQLASPDSLVARLQDSAGTPPLAAALEATDREEPPPQLQEGQDAAGDAWLAEVQRAYAIGRVFWGAFVDLFGLLARPWFRVVSEKGMRETEGRLGALLDTLGLLYGHPLELRKLTLSELQTALVREGLGDDGPTVIGLRPRLATPDAPVRVVTLRRIPVLSPRIDGIVRHNYPGRVLMGLQALSIGLAWQDIVEKGLGSRRDVLRLVATALETVQLAMEAGGLYYTLSARQAALVAQASLRQGAVAGLGRLSSALAGRELLGRVAPALGVAALAVGVMRDLEEAERAMAEGAEERFSKELGESAKLNQYQAINGTVMLGAILLSPVAATAALPVILATTVIGAGLALKQMVVQGEIDRLRLDGPLEYWLKNGYWGTTPYRMKEIDGQGQTVIDYAELAEDVGREIEIVQQILYGFEGRLVWQRRSRKVHGRQRAYARNVDAGVYVDVVLPNPGGEAARVFVKLSATGRDDRRRRTVLAHEIPVRAGRPLAPLPRAVRLKRLPGIAPPVYRSHESRGGGMTLRLRIAPELLPGDIGALTAEIAWDPMGDGEPVIPDAERGLEVALFPGAEDGGKSRLEAARDSNEVYRERLSFREG